MAVPQKRSLVVHLTETSHWNVVYIIVNIGYAFVSRCGYSLFPIEYVSRNRKAEITTDAMCNFYNDVEGETAL